MEKVRLSRLSIQTLKNMLENLVIMFVRLKVAKFAIFLPIFNILNHQLIYACADYNCIYMFYHNTEYHL